MTRGQHARPKFNWAGLRASCVIACAVFLAGVVVYELWRILA